MSAQIITIVVIGVLSLVGMVAIAIWFPEPTDFQLRVFQVVMATAAGGIGAILPGTFGLNLRFAKGAGAIGLFVLVYWVNPPSVQHKAMKTRAFESSMQLGDAALATPGLYRVAEHRYVEASRADPESPLPYNGLGRTYYKEGRFEHAAASYEKAFELSGHKDPTYLYSKANSELASSRLDNAAKTFEDAIKLSGSIGGSELAKIIAYDLAAARFTQWRNAGSPLTSPYYDEAVKRFSLFLESGGYPKQWAQYNRACLRAMNAFKRPSTDPQAKNLRTSATDDLSAAVAEIRSFKGEHRPYHVKLIKSILTNSNAYKQQVGDPPGCPALVETWTKERGTVAKLLAGLD